MRSTSVIYSILQKSWFSSITIGDDNDDADDFSLALRRSLGRHAAVCLSIRLCLSMSKEGLLPYTPIRWLDSELILVIPRSFVKNTCYVQTSATNHCFLTIFPNDFLVSRRISCMKSAAFFLYGGWINIFLHSTTANGSLRCASFQVCCPSRLNFRRSDTIWRTVWVLWPHWQRSSSAIDFPCPHLNNQGALRLLESWVDL